MTPVGTVRQNIQNISWGPLTLHYLWCGVLVLIPVFLTCYEFSLYHLGCRDLFCSWAVWWECCWHHSVRPPRYSYYLCLIALGIFQLGQNIFSIGSNSWRSNSLLFSPDLVNKGVTFATAAANGCCFCCSRCPFAVISDSGRYFEISFSVSPGHIDKDPSLIAWSRVRLVGQHMIWW